jgi:hypothetical protein
MRSFMIGTPHKIFFWMIKSRKMKWAGHGTNMEDNGKFSGFRTRTCLVGKSEGKRLLGRPRHRWKDNIKWLFKRVWTGLICLRIGISGGFCGCGNECLGSIKF